MSNQLSREELALLTDDELEAYVRLQELEADLFSPLTYAVAVSGAERYPHQEMLDQWIMALIEGRLYFDGPGPEPLRIATDSGTVLQHPTRGDSPVYNLAISMPPRHGKSFLVSEHLPAWFLTKFPDYSVLLSSYNETFAGGWGERARDHILEHPEYGLEVRGGAQSSKLDWRVQGHRGFMKCAGVGGTLTGKGGHLNIIDDPIKNDEEAMSAVIRDRQDNWFKSTFYTRRETWKDGTPGRVILMATRWHEDDLTGRRVPTDPELGDSWALLNLPALALEDDPLGRAPGEALCPQRMALEELHSVQKEVGTTWFQAMYQGTPSLDDGNIIQRPFNYYTVQNGRYRMTKPNGEDLFYEPERCYRFGTLDLAASDKKHADWTVLAVFDITPSDPRYLILHALERIRITTENHESYVERWYKQYNLRALHIEDKTFGTNLIARLMHKRGMIIQKLAADTNKLVRALPIQYETRNGRFWLPAGAEWLTTAEAELTKFPLARHDDIVDVIAYGIQVFQHLPGHIIKDREPETMDERVWQHKKQLAKKNKRSLRKRYPTLGRL